MPTPSTEVWEYLQTAYVPDLLAQPRQRGTRTKYECEIRTFEKAFRFHLAEKDLKIRKPTLADLSPDDPQHPCGHLRADELLKFAMGWQIGRGRKVTTANSLYRHVCAVWRHAFARGYVVAPPRTKRYEEPDYKRQAWSLEEMRAILAAAAQLPGRLGDVRRSDFYTALILFVYSTGARRGVAMKVPARNFDARRGEVLLPAEFQKQNADQLLDLLPETVAALARLRSAERGVELLFGDFAMCVRKLNDGLRQIIVAAGLRRSVEQVSSRDLWHKFRRTFATWGCAASDEETMRRLLGHSSVNVTRLYLDERFLPRVSARQVIPSLFPIDPDPAPDGLGALRLHRPEAG
jgi:integrase